MVWSCLKCFLLLPKDLINHFASWEAMGWRLAKANSTDKVHSVAEQGIKTYRKVYWARDTLEDFQDPLEARSLYRRGRWVGGARSFHDQKEQPQGELRVTRRGNRAWRGSLCGRVHREVTVCWLEGEKKLSSSHCYQFDVRASKRKPLAKPYSTIQGPKVAYKKTGEGLLQGPVRIGQGVMPLDYERVGSD